VVKIILTIGAILMLWSSNATAQERLAVGHCVADLRRLCPGTPGLHEGAHPRCLISMPGDAC
jgi:hypothetical protein